MWRARTLRRPATAVLDARDAAFLGDEPRRLGAGDDLKVGSPEHRDQKRFGGAVTPAILDVLLVVAGAVLVLRRAEFPVGARIVAGRVGGGEKGFVAGMRIAAIGDGERPVTAADIPTRRASLPRLA